MRYAESGGSSVFGEYPNPYRHDPPPTSSRVRPPNPLPEVLEPGWRLSIRVPGRPPRVSDPLPFRAVLDRKGLYPGYLWYENGEEVMCYVHQVDWSFVGELADGPPEKSVPIMKIHPS